METRQPFPDERCSCGDPAVIVYVTDSFGDVPFCEAAMEVEINA